jgi:prepilin-type N-terminal cleavage/methylation domain-containing protein
MKRWTRARSAGFTLVEIMIVSAIIGLLAMLAIPAFAAARENSTCACCRQNRRIIFEQLNLYCMDHGVELTPANFPNLCAARNVLAPGGSDAYVKDWKIFECPIQDAQNQHDYQYAWNGDELVDIRCGNSDPAVRSRHNR